MIERISTDLPVPADHAENLPALHIQIEVFVDHLITEGIDQPANTHRVLALKPLVPLRLFLAENLVDDSVHPQPIPVKNTAKNASSTMTVKIAWTTALVVRSPTSSELPRTCIP